MLYRKAEAHLPEQVAYVVETATGMAKGWDGQSDPLPLRAQPRFAHAWIGTQAVLGACTEFGYTSPINREQYEQLWRFARAALAPVAYTEAVAERHNSRQAYRDTGEKAYLTVHGTTYFDGACQTVAENRTTSLADMGLIVENSRFGRSGAGFVADDHRFPRKSGFVKQMIGSEIGSAWQRAYARRLGTAVSHAAYDRYQWQVPGIPSDRRHAIAAANLALEFGVKLVGHAQYEADQQERSFVPSPIEAFAITRLGDLLAPRSPYAKDRNELNAQYLAYARAIVQRYGTYGTPNVRDIHGTHSPFFDELKRSSTVTTEAPPYSWYQAQPNN